MCSAFSAVLVGMRAYVLYEALTLLSDVCIPAAVEQEAGLSEVKNMVLLILHLLVEPYSESLIVD